jgi:hypothetical protein
MQQMTQAADDASQYTTKHMQNIIDKRETLLINLLAGSCKAQGPLRGSSGDQTVGGTSPGACHIARQGTERQH